MAEPILDVAGGGKSVRLPTGKDLSLLRGLSLHLPQGASMAVMGPSGSGKSTLLRCLGLFTPFDEGSYSFQGHDVRAMGDRECSALRSREIGFVFQEFRLIPSLTARKNVEYACLLAGMDRRERKLATASALERVGLSERMTSRPKHLSGGEQQRVSIARALVKKPSLVLADEPTGALDRATADAVIDLLLQTIHENSAALIVVTHDEAIAERCDITVDLRDGALHQRAVSL